MVVCTGTMQLKAMTSVTRDTIRKFLIEKVLPAIKEKWPAEERGCPIFIQQDNAKTHIAVDDPDFCRDAQADGCKRRATLCYPSYEEGNIRENSATSKKASSR